MKRLLLLTLMLLVLLSASFVSAQPAIEDTVVLAFTRQPDSLFIDFAATATASYAMHPIYNSLVTTDAEGNLVGELAESWELSEDQRTWTFKLREDVLWHDGEPFDAEDVKFTFEFSAHPDYTGSQFDETLLGALEKQRGEADSVEGVQVIDQYTVAFTTVEPNALFLSTVGQRYIMPEHVLRDVPVAELSTSRQASAPIGTGPYRLVEWNRDESIIYEAFDEHFAGRPNITNYIWRIIPESTLHITELLGNTVDIVPEVPADDFPSLEGEPGVTTIQLPGVNMVTLLMNTDLPMFSDARVRRAISYAIDRQSIVDAVTGGMGEPVATHVHPGLPEFNDEIEPYPYDPERALELLAEVGWTDEDGDGTLEAHGIEGIEDGTPFEFSLGTLPQPLYSLPAQVIQENLSAIGIQTELNTVEFNIYFSEFLSTENPDYEAGMSGWFNLTFPPQIELADNYATYGSGSYRTNWENAEFDELLRRTPVTFDDAERNALFARAQEILNEEQPWIYLIRPNNLIAHDSELIIPELAHLNQLFATVQDWAWRE